MCGARAGTEAGTERNHGPSKPGHLLPVAAVLHRGRDRRVRNGHPQGTGLLSQSWLGRGRREEEGGIAVVR